MEENHYTNAVNNFEKLVNHLEKELSKDTLETLRYNIMYLKLYPDYNGQLPEQKDLGFS
jgi:hypothetical protein